MLSYEVQPDDPGDFALFLEMAAKCVDDRSPQLIFSLRFSENRFTKRPCGIPALGVIFNQEHDLVQRSVHNT